MQNVVTSRDQRRGTHAGWPLLSIAAVAFAVVAPFFLFGIPSGHDFDFHLNSWMEVLTQWRQGILYPRWAASAHYGYGEARFIFYPPSSWILGAALGAVLPWKIVPGAYVWFSLALSGWSMFVAAQRWLIRKHALLAAILYAVNPYYIVIVYWRSAFAELLAGALLPLLVLCVMEIDIGGRKAIVPLSLIVGAAALTNVPASMIVNYSLLFLALTVAIHRRSPRVLLYAAAAGLLGAAMAAFYIVPAFYEQKWINIAQVLSPGVCPQDNFLFTTTADADHNRFNRLVSLLAAAELAVLTIAVLFSRARRQKPQLWGTLLVWVGASALLMFSFSVVFWRHLPGLRFVQLPWRWLLCLNVSLILLTPISWKHWLWRGVAFLLLFGVLGWSCLRVQPPWWDHAEDISELLTAHRTEAGYEGTDEYVPAGADPYDIKQGAPLVALNPAGQLRVQVQRWNPETKAFTAETEHSGKLRLRLFNYPAWQVEVNGRKVRTETQDDTGELQIPIAAGENQVRIRFVRTWDRIFGEVVSLVSIAGLLLWFARERVGRG